VTHSQAFAARLRAGERLFAAGVVTSVTAVEILGDCGFDWLFLDAETAPFSFADIQHMVRAAQLAGVPAVVRLNNDLPQEIRQVLDMGAAGVIIPLVRSAAQARAIVAAAKYPPQGERGAAAARAQGYGYGGHLKNYLATANTETAVIVMVEDRVGLEQVEEIAAVEGLDGIFVGPGDLSLSLGCQGQHLHEDMLSAFSRIAVAARENGVALGTMPSSREMYRLCVDWGFRMILTGLDTALLRSAASARLAEISEW
jgi:2-keto-3-deoxy-L-rhamnonate aldolase RhmA